MKRGVESMRDGERIVIADSLVSRVLHRRYRTHHWPLGGHMDKCAGRLTGPNEVSLPCSSGIGASPAVT